MTTTIVSLRSQFVIAGASIVGPAHARAGRNNQDAWSVWIQDDFGVLVVADGCSGGFASEVGAQLTARWLTAQAARRWRGEYIGRHDEFIGELFDGLTREMGALANALAPKSKQIPAVVADLFLSTVVVAIIDRSVASIFGIGDGIAVINGMPNILKSNKQRGPEYLAYRLCDAADTGYDPGAITPRTLAQIETQMLHTLALATDGAEKLLPPEAEIDRLAALFDDGQVARRPALLHKRLAEIAAEPGVLDDDVTLVALLAKNYHDKRQ